MTTSQQITARLSGTLGEFSLNIDFSCPMHGITALFGPSGCGKTSVLRSLAGLFRMQGQIRVGKETWQDDNSRLFLPTHQRPIGYVFQEASLFPHLNVRSNLEFGLKRITKQQRRVAFDEAVELLGITQLLAHKPSQLSGGQRQRVAIARALLASPQLLLMDEPLAALDQQSKNEILPYLERLHDEMAMPVIYVSHAADEIARLSDHLLVMRNGQVIASGPTHELHTRLDMAKDAGQEADAILNAKLIGHEEHFHLSELQTTGARFLVSQIDRPIGTQVRLRVLARDVSITLEQSTQTSILNVFPAQVTEMTEEGKAQMLIKLDVNGTTLLSRITRKSAAHLQLQPNKRVYAQVKAVALFS